MTNETTLTPASAEKLSRILTAKHGPPETASGVVPFMGIAFCDHSWRLRDDDGSALARLGFGPTRKLVTLSRSERAGQIAYYVSVFIPGRRKPGPTTPAEIHALTA